MTSFRTAIAIAVGTLFAGTALAQSNYEIEQRDRNEQARIERGIQSGQLTHREADRLLGERAQIERMERRARADGTLSQHERARIDHAQDRLSRDIYRESHDRQTANRDGNSWGRPHGWDRGNGNGWGRGHDQGNHYGWNRGNDQGNHNGWTRGAEHGNSTGHQQSEHRDGTRGQRNESHSNGMTPRTGGETRTGRTEWNNSRQTSMPQAQARSTPSQGTRTFTAARGDSGRRTR